MVVVVGGGEPNAGNPDIDGDSGCVENEAVAAVGSRERKRRRRG